MKRSTLSTPPKLTTDAIRQYVGALPTVDDRATLDEQAAQATRSVLEKANPTLEQRLQAQIKTITNEVAAYLDQDSTTGQYVITDIELQGIVARAATRTTSQFAVDIGEALTDTVPVTVQLKLPAPADDRNKAGSYKQPDLLQEY